MKASASAATISINHQYSRIRSILLPSPLCVVTTTKIDQIGEQKPEKKARDCDGHALGEERQACRVLCPLRARDTRQLTHQADELGGLEIVGRPGEDQS